MICLRARTAPGWVKGDVWWTIESAIKDDGGARAPTGACSASCRDIIFGGAQTVQRWAAVKCGVIVELAIKDGGGACASTEAASSAPFLLIGGAQGCYHAVKHMGDGAIDGAAVLSGVE